MQSLWARFQAIRQKAWLDFVSHLNAIITLVCGSLVMISQVYPTAIQTVTASLSPMQQGIAMLVFCSLVQYALHRAKRNDNSTSNPQG